MSENKDSENSSKIKDDILALRISETIGGTHIYSYPYVEAQDQSYFHS